MIHDQLQVSPELQTNIHQFVACKYEIDTALMARKPLPYGFEEAWPDSWVDGWRTIDPDTFMRTVWPFWEEGLPADRETTLGLVAPDLVIGASDAWRPDILTEEDMAKLFKKTEAQVQNFQETGEWRSYLDGYGFIGAHPQARDLSPFGLYVAHEGKNRVAAFALHGRSIAYDLRKVHFPRAEELMLERKNGQWRLRWGKQVRELQYCTEILVLIFKAYGVQECEIVEEAPGSETIKSSIKRNRVLDWLFPWTRKR